ncbi:hypothetical protein [uncultured Enterococcus sp.]|uniref:hypothetical protein n=1 Tax=uncultured Enterococcus sp. TaxID=167972 RepID=UPI002AA76191|nr:hypothetical protein [uncultured Enterococcus sp.]
MGLSFFVGEMQAQASEAMKLGNEYIQHAGTLKDSVNHFLNAPLSSKTYDSARNYFMAVYPPLANALILAGESLSQAHADFPAKFQEIVGGGDIEEDRLLEQIQQGKDLLDSYREVLNKLEEPNHCLEHAYMRTQESIRKLEEKLEDLYLFDSISPAIFADAEANINNLEAAISAVSKSRAWNPASGTFDISRLDMTWARPINEAWKKRQEKKEALALTQALSNGNVNYDVEVTADEFGNPSYFVYKNGQLDAKLTAELAGLMAEFRLSEYQKFQDSPVGKLYTFATSAMFIVDGTKFVVNGLVNLGNGLAIGYGVNAVTGEATQLLVRADGAVISEALATVSVGVSEILTGVSISAVNWGQTPSDGNPKIVSKIDEDTGLKREAEKMGKNEVTQKESDQLIEKISNGNMNPGTGYKNLFKDVIYIRGRNGARVFYRKVDGVIEILGKANKDNETKVIQILMKKYK